MSEGSLVTLQVAIVLFWFATAFYAGATVLYAYFFLSKKKAHSWYATFLTGAGFLCQTASIGLYSTHTEGTILTGANSLVLAAWTLVLVYFMVEHLAKLKVYGTFLVPVAAVLMFAAAVLGLDAAAQLTGEQAALLDSGRVGIHVAIIMLANAGFAVGGVASIIYLAQEAQLKRHTAGKWLKRLPSLAQTDLIARRAIAAAYPAYTAGLLLGVIRAIETDVGGWFLDARVVLAGIVWAVFGVYLYLHYGRGTAGRTAAWVAIVGLVFVIVTAIAARTLPAGFHIFGVAGS